MSTTATPTLSTELTVLHTAVDPQLGEVSHADADCPRLVGISTVTTHRLDDPARGWLCSVCIEVAPRRNFRPGDATTTRGDSIDRPDPNTDGAGEGSSAPAAKPYTWTKVGEIWAVRVPAGAHSTGDTVTVAKKSGETREVTLGRQLAAAGTRGFDAFAEADTVDDCYRWTQVRGQWLVQGPTADAPALGRVLTICKRDGSTKQARIVLECGDADNGKSLYEVEEVKAIAEAPAAPAAPLADVPEGHYAIASEGHNDLFFVRIDRPTDGRWAGRVFAKMIVGGKPDSKIAANRIPGILARIAAAGVAEAGALYGQEIGRCYRCNRTLTDETSRQLGIGPDCRSRD